MDPTLNSTERVVELLELIAKPDIDPDMLERLAQKIVDMFKPVESVPRLEDE
jgi:hypothetical protein